MSSAGSRELSVFLRAISPTVDAASGKHRDDAQTTMPRPVDVRHTRRRLSVLKNHLTVILRRASVCDSCHNARKSGCGRYKGRRLPHHGNADGKYCTTGAPSVPDEPPAEATSAAISIRPLSKGRHTWQFKHL
jgi:hypothetical protein